LPAPRSAIQAVEPTGGTSFADVNNDKKLDAVFVCNGYISVALGNGDGTFQAPAYYAVNNGTEPLLVDLNGDGYLDIVSTLVTSRAVLGVAVLLNNGSSGPGVFASSQLYPLPTNASSLPMVAGDFNGDGKQDLLTTVSGPQGSSLYPVTGGVSILFGKGDGTLRSAVTQSTPAFGSFTTGDFDGDGVTDLALLLNSASFAIDTSVQILLGSTSGTFAPGASVPIAATAGTATGSAGPMAAVALSENGPLDLVVSNTVLNVFRGDGKGNFTPTGSYAVSTTPLLFADLKGDGKQDLIATGLAGVYILPGNGDGTFQALPATPIYGTTADVNNDGIADILFFPASTPQAGSGNSFATALGRGDGTYSVLDQTTTLPSAKGYQLMLGDFNGDGKIDTVAIQPGSNLHALPCGQADAQLASYVGTGDGRFQAVGTPLALGVSDADVGVTGDFNSDGNLDLILPYSLSCQPGLLFLPGKGDGTFGSPVALNAFQGLQNPVLVAGDLNHDKKLDLIWGDAVFLGNGDGTFKQSPLNPTSPPTVSVIALADLNGDGILDAVFSPGTSIYAGNGDGTFQTTPFYTAEPQYAEPFAIADVNGDGHPDLLFAGETDAIPYLAVFLGDGHGDFTRDPNNYFLGSFLDADLSPSTTTPARLNNQAPPVAGDNRLDVSMSIIVNGGLTYTASLLNQTNPTPVAPAPITSTTALQASPMTAAPNATITFTASVFGTNPTGTVSFAANGNNLGTEDLANGTGALQTSFVNAGSYTVTATYSGDTNNTASTSGAATVTITPATSSTTLVAPSGGNVNGQITLKATVSGDSPTGSVSFSAGSTSLGTATLTGGVAALQTSFAAAGSYSVTAAYPGDPNNAASTSNPAAIVIAAPDFTVSATPTTGTITPGQTATFAFTISPVGGYTGTVNFSCGTLPSLAACSFSPPSVTPSGGSPASTTMTVTTAASTAMLNPDQRSGRPWLPAGGLALTAALGLVFTPKKIRRWHRSLRGVCWGLLMASLSFSLFGCGGGGSGRPSNSGTPAGSYTISVNVSGSAGGPQHALSLSLTVQ
jgi:Bacterial Ig-like domain (group 3)/FG-GAP-like repeat